MYGLRIARAVAFPLPEPMVRARRYPKLDIGVFLCSYLSAPPPLFLVSLAVEVGLE